MGFFDLIQELEVITIENLTITGNTILRSLLSPIDTLGQGSSIFGYGAICVPDVENLVIRDNNVTDFGQKPGDDVCGIFILHGEMVEISRNHVLETRDWAKTGEGPAGGFRGGIVVFLATPPTSPTTSWYSDTTFTGAQHPTPVYLPGLPALRVEHNVVRVPLGRALEVYGYGPFSIVNNHFGCGGRVRATGRPLGEAVLILNLGTAIEAGSSIGKYSDVNQGTSGFSTNNTGLGAAPSNGVVLFTNNVCQLELQFGRHQCFASVVILTLDDLIFSNNQCWLDGAAGAAYMDALLLAGSIEVTSNRFQEARNFPVLISAFTIGALNITSQNISTYCLLATGTLQPAIDNNNLSLINSEICSRLAETLQLNTQ